jgi:hypothetical protein
VKRRFRGFLYQQVLGGVLTEAFAPRREAAKRGKVSVKD